MYHVAKSLYFLVGYHVSIQHNSFLGQNGNIKLSEVAPLAVRISHISLFQLLPLPLLVNQMYAPRPPAVKSIYRVVDTSWPVCYTPTSLLLYSCLTCSKDLSYHLVVVESDDVWCGHGQRRIPCCRHPCLCNKVATTVRE